MKAYLVAAHLLISLLPTALSISCYSCSTVEVDPAVDNLTNEDLRTYASENQTFDLIAGSLQTDCDESAVKVCSGDRCIASHIRLESIEGGGDQVTLGTISLKECGAMWLEKDDKFCRSAEDGISDPNLKAECYMTTCQQDLCNIPDVLLEPLEPTTNVPVEPTPGEETSEDEVTQTEVSDGDSSGEIDQGSNVKNMTEGAGDETVENDPGVENNNGMVTEDNDKLDVEETVVEEQEESGDEIEAAPEGGLNVGDETNSTQSSEEISDTEASDAEEEILQPGEEETDSENDEEESGEAEDSDTNKNGENETDSSLSKETENDIESENESESGFPADSGCFGLSPGRGLFITTVIFILYSAC